MSIAHDTSQTEEVFLVNKRNQHTIRNTVSISGIGLFTGKEVLMTLKPAESGTGIVFKRTDLANEPIIEAKVENVLSTNRTTVIGSGKITVTCVEHLLSALYAYNIDNVLIEINSGEPPVLDGSSKGFVSLVESAKVSVQKEEIELYFLQKPQYFQDGDATIVALPSKTLQFDYTLSYKNQPLLDAQYMHFDFAKNNYKKEISPCRTFALAKEVRLLLALRMIKNTSRDYGLIVDKNSILYDKKLHFSNEMARHKILDMMGDFALGKRIIARFVAIKSGHKSNIAFAKTLSKLVKG